MKIIKFFLILFSILLFSEHTNTFAFTHDKVLKDLKSATEKIQSNLKQQQNNQQSSDQQPKTDTTSSTNNTNVSNTNKTEQNNSTDSQTSSSQSNDAKDLKAKEDEKRAEEEKKEQEKLDKQRAEEQEKLDKQRADQESRHKLFGIKIGSKLTDYKVIKKIHTFKFGSELILIDPPQKNDEFKYYMVTVSPISKTVYSIAGYTKKTFGKYKPVERLEYLSNLSNEQLNPMNMILSDKKTFCTNIESGSLKLATENVNDDKSFQQYVEFITNYFRVTLPRAKGREVIKRCYLIDASTYDVETPLKSVLNDLNTVYRNNINRNKCQSYLDTYKTYFLQKFNLDKNKLQKSERAVGLRTITKFPGYISSSQGFGYFVSFNDLSDTWNYEFNCPDSVPDYNSDIRGEVALSAKGFNQSKIFPEMREYNKNKKTQNDQQQKQQNQQKIDNLNKKGL